MHPPPQPGQPLHSLLQVREALEAGQEGRELGRKPARWGRPGKVFCLGETGSQGGSVRRRMALSDLG